MNGDQTWTTATDRSSPGATGDAKEKPVIEAWCPKP